MNAGTATILHFDGAARGVVASAGPHLDNGRLRAGGTEKERRREKRICA